MHRPLSQQTLVITGATSGIGLATAQQAAAAGARVLMVARDLAALDRQATLLRERYASGGATIAVAAADVARRDEVERAAQTAVAQFGGIDTWINNAGVAWVGSVIDDYDEARARRLVDTNFWGVVNGSLAAVAQMRRRGGTLINVGSMLSDRAVPLQSVYSAAKHAVKGFTDGLRQELRAAGVPIDVVLVKPASIATPLIEHAAHPPGRRPRLVSPLYTPDDVAAAMLRAAVQPVRDLHIGAAARAVGVIGAVAPELLDLASTDLVQRQWRHEPSDGSGGNLDTPSTDSHGRVYGDHPGQSARPSGTTRVESRLGPISQTAFAMLETPARVLRWVLNGRR
jgi:short-subunit dehydrogenase